MVFYRKYRPQTIHELDSVQVRETLTAVLTKGSSHAFLFTGPKGLGKTSTARIVAKAVNCTQKKKNSVEPCNQCEQCVSIANGTNLDVFEIDAASNRGIDEIRELKEKITLTPLAAAKKVYIIDEVHMLTTEAFNALLKTLEEPPSHAMFILCTTENQKVPATILSRCFHISFTPATPEELIRSFKRIVTGEKLDVSDETLELIAEHADHGFRDGAKLLEEFAALSHGNTITKEMVEERFKTGATRDAVIQFLSHLERKDTHHALQLLREVGERGLSFAYFQMNVIETLHAELLAKTHVSGETVTKFSLPELHNLLMLLAKAIQDAKFSVLEQLPLELAVVEWCMQDEVINKHEEISRNTKHKHNASSVEVTVDEKLDDQNGEVTVTTLRKEVGNMAKIKALYGEEKKEGKVKLNPDDAMSILDFSADGEITAAWLTSFWKALIAEVKAYNHTLAGILRGCMIKSFDRKELIIETAYTFHKEKLDEGKTMEMLEKVCKTLTGKPVTIAIILKST